MSSGVPTEPGPEPAAEPSPSTAAADTASLPAAAEHTGRPFVGSSEVIQPAPGVGGDGAQAAATTVADGHKTDTKTGKRRRGGLSFLQELPFLLLVAFVLALLIKTFLIQAFYIPSESMVPTLKIGDRVLVNKLTYHLHPPRRGDVVVFQDPHPATQVHRNPFSAFVHWLGEGLGLSTSPDKDFIKRVIGLPGDTVQLRLVNGTAVVFINGHALKEPYLAPLKETRPFGPVTVPKESLFVMGDNRTNSNDSRYGLGFIPEDKVVGRAFVIIWPPSRLRWLSGIHYP